VRILVDTSIWSLALRRKHGLAGMNEGEKRLVAALAEGIRDGRIAVVGPIRQEVLSGVKHEAQFDKLRRALAAFPDAPIEPEDYVQAARFDNLCRAAGVQCGTVDMLLIAVAWRSGWTILTKDDGLARCIEAVERNAAETGPARGAQRLLFTTRPD
jgi:predicted nucleic acid-binding protein